MRSFGIVIALLLAPVAMAQGDPTMEPAASEIAWAEIQETDSMFEIASVGQYYSNQIDWHTWLSYAGANQDDLNDAMTHLDYAEDEIDDAITDWTQGAAHVSLAHVLMTQALYGRAFVEAGYAIDCFQDVYPHCTMAAIELVFSWDLLLIAEQGL